MALIFANNASSKLATGISNSGVTLVVTAGEGAKFPAAGSGSTCMITVQDSTGAYEIMTCTARTTDTLTVTRAQESTTARAFSAGATVANRFTAGTMTGYAQTAAVAAGYQPLDASLTALAGVTTGANKLTYATAADTFTTTNFTAAARTLLDDATTSDMRTTLGLGSAATLTAGTSANNLLQLDSSSKIPAVDGSQLTNLPASSGLPTDYITGLALRIDTDTDHDIEIGIGSCRDSTDAYDMALAAVLTKRIDASWAAGDDAGGMDTGSVGSSTYYYIWLIRKDSDESIDALFSTSSSAPTMPAGYTYKRCVGRLYTNGSANILTTTLISANPAIPSTELILATRSFVTPPWARNFKMTLQAVGGAVPQLQASDGGGGGGGGAGIRWYRGVAAGTAWTTTIGTGTNSSSFGADVTATAGAAGATALPGIGGGCSGADININGSRGFYLIMTSGMSCIDGGRSLLGAGGIQTATSGEAVGVAGSGYGGGAAGVRSTNNMNAGAAGGPAVCIIDFE